MKHKYKQLQIIKHALQYYIERDGATPKDIEDEKRLLESVTEEVNARKERFQIL